MTLHPLYSVCKFLRHLGGGIKMFVAFMIDLNRTVVTARGFLKTTIRLRRLRVCRALRLGDLD